MDFTLKQEIPAPVEQVEAALVDPVFLVRMAELPKLGSAEVVSSERDGDTVKLAVRYLFQADLSPAVSRFVDPSQLTWVEDSTIDLVAHHTRCEIKPDNYANMLSGKYEARIETSRVGCVRTVTGLIKVHVPLVGGKAEKAIVGGLSENAAAQTTLLTEFISA
jgi:Protein of unknown function (DUF2505)